MKVTFRLYPTNRLKCLDSEERDTNWRLAFGRRGVSVLQAISCQRRSYFLRREKIRNCWKIQHKAAPQNIIPMAGCERKYFLSGSVVLLNFRSQTYPLASDGDGNHTKGLGLIELACKSHIMLLSFPTHTFLTRDILLTCPLWFPSTSNIRVKQGNGFGCIGITT
jgi:hypothetical protein